MWLLKEETAGINGKKKKYAKDSQIKLPNESPTYGLMQSLTSQVRPSFVNEEVDQDFKQKMQARSWYLTPKMQTLFWAKNFNQHHNKANINI